MVKDFTVRKIPGSRIATFDIFSIGLKKHHIVALLEFDVTESRRKLHEQRRKGSFVSFNAWLIKVIGSTLAKHPEATAYLSGKRKMVIFNDINISILVEKTIGGEKVPVPVIIENTEVRSASEITSEIEKAKATEMSAGDIVVNRGTTLPERIYYHAPGFVRRLVWRVMLGNPSTAYKKMGNVVVTSVGMVGRVNGWFIHRSVHPVSFGIGSVIKKAVVVNEDIRVREILNMTILVDHDLVDGAPMVRLLKDLTRSIENGDFI